jgi:ribosomal protein L11 methyltransferase
VAVDANLAEEVIWRLEDLGATAIEIRDEQTLSRLPPGQVDLLAGFDTTAIREGARRGILLQPGVLAADALDVGGDGWRKGWREFHQPVVLDAIQVVAPWIDPPVATLPSIVVDPGRAFGTGAHATTRLLLEMLGQRAQQRRLPQRALDVGTGSGILAIAAARLGVEKIMAIDNDEEAIKAAEKNVERNRVGHEVELRAATPSALSGSWPLVLANLDLSCFGTHAADIADRTAPGGEALLSGLLPDQARSCLELLSDLDLEEQTDRDGWIALAMRRRR